ncbi:MAG TPA: CHASE domain-containing protein, partial [Luteimonas sp.]|nr:CHASE domain-containing protein [Luteimonas sp.]
MRTDVRPIAWRAYLLAVLVLLGSLTVVGLYARSAAEREASLREAQFSSEAAEVASLLRQALLTVELTVRGGVSLSNTVQGADSRQWRDYVAGLDLAGRFPAIVGLGFAAYLSPAELEALQLQRRRDGEGLFRLFPGGRRARYGPVVQLEPRTPPNAAVIGADMFAEPARNLAMVAARDGSAMQLTAPVRLLQDDGTGNGAGLIVYAPVYRAGFVPASRSARDAALVGWVFAPLRTRQFVASALGRSHPGVRLRIVDVTDGIAKPLYPADEEAWTVAGDGFEHVIEQVVHGRRWQLQFSQPPGTQAPSNVHGTVAVGLLSSLLLFAVALTLARTQSRAEHLAAQMSESYRRSEVRFRNAMRHSAIGKALLDSRGRIVEANLALANILRSSPDDLAGELFWLAFEDGRDDVAADGRLRVVADGVYRVTRCLPRSEGDARRVHLTYAPVPGEIGQDVAALVQVEDVTDRLRAEADVLESNRTLEANVALRTRQLTRANEELEAFAYTISHDLRAPLRAIDGFSRHLAEQHAQQLDAAGLECLARVRAQATRMDELIDALLGMSQLAREGMTRTALDLGAMAADIVAELRRAEPGRQVEVAIAAGLRAEGDAALVHNLLQNLIGNAWKFTADTA